jgi:8-oxo-dGTP diphosphatase
VTSTDEYYKNRIRVRVCGLCFKDSKILLVKQNLNGRLFYAPPGGAIEFGENIEDGLKRELLEETNIEVIESKYQFITEYVKPPLHAIELFYSITSWNGSPSIGSDPESKEIILIQDVKFYSSVELKKINNSELHHVLHSCNNPRDLLELSGYIQHTKKM